ncbi:MAG: tripartite tricarboxylate transporter substrate binding protein [Ramlibacter sp.]|uniref:Bug family tripartite tricarboxylate transporter substrate binding protein n=1 Tax=Ramlibacter sp. TaxID=1917967 RepID=UPI002618DE40|nr:tripartite tricarboxylate transporter substrate binding protein [Ramlibacter sp.]MDH4377736.1 tripartite tricarboxylate transporter substrate binding protein [Ramlibacter sp.]
MQHTSLLPSLTRATRLAAALATATLALWQPAAQAQPADDFPNKPVKLIVPFSPGGSTDVIARLVAKEMSRTLGQPVVVENKDGASGAIATDFVAKAAPDGYTLCYCTTGSIAILPLLDSKLSYRPDRDLAAVTLAVNQPFGIVVRSNLGVNNFREFVAMAKANPGKISFGSPGTATPSHLTGEMLAMATGTELRHAPYRGDAPAVQDLTGGHIDAMMLSAVSVKGVVDTGRVKLLAVSSLTRLRQFPDVPTVAELGYAGFQTNNLQALYAPAKTPPAVIAKLNAAAIAALRTQEAVEKIAGQGLIIIGDTPASAAKTMKDESERWAPVVQKLDLRR